MKAFLTIEGVVKKGKNRGKSMGYPTVNFPVDPIIPEGIYISEIKINKKVHQSVTFIGNVLTFNEEEYVCETYILDYEKDIYGEKVTVYLIKKIRDNQKFDSEKDLIKQMDEDINYAKSFFSENRH
jgi:riboflavin kinase / FMN adenylyltransferase